MVLQKSHEDLLADVRLRLVQDLQVDDGLFAALRTARIIVNEQQLERLQVTSFLAILLDAIFVKRLTSREWKQNKIQFLTYIDFQITWLEQFNNFPINLKKNKKNPKFVSW